MPRWVVRSPRPDPVSPSAGPGDRPLQLTNAHHVSRLASAARQQSHCRDRDTGERHSRDQGHGRAPHSPRPARTQPGQDRQSSGPLERSTHLVTSSLTFSAGRPVSESRSRVSAARSESADSGSGRRPVSARNACSTAGHRGQIRSHKVS